MSASNEQEIGDIGSEYGLSVKADGGRFFWSIEGPNGHRWEQIPEYLYRALVQYQEDRPRRVA